jgi:uncharacterized protein with HEPN domain
MQSKLGDKQRLLHILQAINEIDSFVGGLPATIFFENSLIKSGSVFQLQIIGEAANHLSKELTGKYSEIEWQQIVGTRNIIAHFYWGIDYVQVWEIIKTKLPQLKEEVTKILSEIN